MPFPLHTIQRFTGIFLNPVSIIGTTFTTIR